MSSEKVVAVDCHAHVMRRDLPLAPDRHSGPTRDVTVEEFLGEMDTHGISHGVLTAPSFYGTNNSLLLAALAAASGRLRGTAIVAPDIPEEELADMDRRGVVGIRLNWIRRDTLADVESAAYRRLFERLRKLDWQVEVYLEGPKLAMVLPRIRQQGVKVVVDHFGAPDPARGIECPGFQEVLRGVRAGDTYVKLSAPYRQGGADPQAYVDALLDASGPGQLVWATDWPFVGFEGKITYAQCVEWIESWIPDAATRSVVMAATPAKLFHFEERS
ncbi:MAG TPA: amidohydrolase family protein [Usitatibacter sp.]|nr:amidohydrolase family protein [Usitatibacter sp.]